MGIATAALAVVSAIAGFIVVLAIAPLEPSRAAIDRDGDGHLVVVVGLCPGETVRRIQISSWEDDLTWIVEGRGSSQERWPVNDPLPAGYRLIASSTDLSGGFGTVTLDVSTTKEDWYTDTSQRELDRPGMSVEGERVTQEQYPDAARDAYPCDDPYQIAKRAAAAGISIGAYAVLVLITFVLLRPWRRRPEPLASPGQ